MARVMHHRREIIEPTVAEHHGRIIKWLGDGFLAMFDSPLEAVRCAIVIQQAVTVRNTSLVPINRIEYRMGVNLGDVIIKDDDIYGDGVNVAARLQTSATPGTVNISGGVYEQIKNKLVVGYQSLGDEKLKNITDPVRIYRVLPDPAAVQTYSRRKVWIGSTAAAVALMGIGGGLTYWVMRERPPFAATQIAAAPPRAPDSNAGHPLCPLQRDLARLRCRRPLCGPDRSRRPNRSPSPVWPRFQHLHRRLRHKLGKKAATAKAALRW